VVLLCRSCAAVVSDAPGFDSAPIRSRDTSIHVRAPVLAPPLSSQLEGRDSPGEGLGIRIWASKGGGRNRNAGDEEGLGPMSVVVERGSARCPHCVAVADYTFVESDVDMVRYEVHCHSCGEVYSEESSLAPPVPVERVLPMPPLPPVTPRASWRGRLASVGRVAGRLGSRVRPSRGMPTPGEYGANG